jgi:2',3'-cyclic-nucleotide 2'-phosphodiesterase (5'-nucleotidase family)
MRIALVFVLFLSTAYAADLTILFTSNTRGEIKTCGCGTVTLGGLARRSTLIHSSANPILLDAGDTFYMDAEIPNHLRSQTHRQAEAIVKAYEAMKYDAILLGETDRILDEKQLSKLPILTPNGPPKIIRRGQVAVAIFGIRGDLKPLYTQIQIEVGKAKTQGHFVVALFHGSEKERKSFLKSVSGIDIIIAGHNGELMKNPVRQGKTLVFEAGERGQYVGKIELGIGDRAKPIDEANRLERVQREREFRFEAEDASSPHEKIVYERALSNLPALPKNYFAYEPIPIATTLAPDPAIEKLLQF